MKINNSFPIVMDIRYNKIKYEKKKSANDLIIDILLILEDHMTKS